MSGMITRFGKFSLTNLYWWNIPAWRESLMPIRNRRRFANEIFKYIFLNENVWISIEISLKFRPEGSNKNITDYRRIYVSLGFNELIHHQIRYCSWYLIHLSARFSAYSPRPDDAYNTLHMLNVSWTSLLRIMAYCLLNEEQLTQRRPLIFLFNNLSPSKLYR